LQPNISYPTIAEAIYGQSEGVMIINRLLKVIGEGGIWR
jgi:hypothetical protein